MNKLLIYYPCFLTTNLKFPTLESNSAFHISDGDWYLLVFFQDYLEQINQNMWLKKKKEIC